MNSNNSSIISDLLQFMRPNLLKSIGSLALIDPQQIACGVTDSEGRLIACDNLTRNGNLQDTCEIIRQYFGENMHRGDIVITNDPYSGGTRIQDLFGLTPVEIPGNQMVYILASLPLPDLGGMALGGNYPKAQEIWAEGVRVTPVKLCRRGVLQTDALTMLTLNSRLPHLVENDAGSLRSTLEESALRLLEGLKKFPGLFPEFQKEIELKRNYLQERIQDFPQEALQGTSESIHQCLGDFDLSVKVKLSKKDKTLELDFTGSSEQSLGFINSTASTTSSVAISGIIHALGIDIGSTSGITDLFEIKMPENSFLNAQLPVSVGWSVYQPTIGILQAIYSALGKSNLQYEEVFPKPPEFPFRIKGCGERGCTFTSEDLLK